jgi:hypothetical protein
VNLGQTTRLGTWLCKYGSSLALRPAGEALLCDRASAPIAAYAPLSGLVRLRVIALSDCQSHTTMVKCRGARSLVNDLITGQGVVSSRAALTLRSVEPR